MDQLKPQDAGQASEIIQWAAAEQKSLEILGGGSKRALGRPVRADLRLDVSGLSGVVDYEPAELVLTARAATPMAEIEALLAQKGQMLAFEPPDWRSLLAGSEAAEPTADPVGEPTSEPTSEPTLGGVLACNLAGPRRVRAGAARDYFLGFSAINGRGELFKAGGKVVKNVTGYDMCKLMAGSYGTLGLLTEVTLKAMPRPEAACTLLLPGLSEDAAIGLLARALNTPHEVSAAAHLPDAISGRSRFADPAAGGLTALRIEGPAPSIAFRAAALEALLGGGERLDALDTEFFWGEIARVHALLPKEEERLVWRLCPTPSAAPKVVRQVRDRFPSAEAFYDWGGGLVWLSLDKSAAGEDGGAAFIRALLRLAGGHATLVVAPGALRSKIEVFEPEDAALANLGRRVKTNFDPQGILNPGRVREGW
jgi:glycolate oxidase FAD binding subunit